MPRYKLTVAYDGTDFHGWQRQLVPAKLAHQRLGGAPAEADEGPVPDEVIGPVPTAPEVAPAGARTFPRLTESGRVELRTVQSVLEQAVREVVREPVELSGASRTDAGVHARGQVGAFTCSDGAPEGRGWPAERGTHPLVRAINSRLPADALVTAAEIVRDDFRPIGDAASKGYSYTLHVSPHRPLWDRRYVTHCWVPLDVGAMRDAAARIVGRHDFAAFAATGHGRQSTVRRVLACDVTAEGQTDATQRARSGAQRSQKEQRDPEQRKGTSRADAARASRDSLERSARESADWAGRVRIDVAGDGFLYNMVRIIAGTLVEVGRGKWAPARIDEILAGKDRRRAGPTLPPEGLCLEWIEYPRTESP